MVPKWAHDGPVGTLNCQVIDPDLSQVLGQWVQLNFNGVGWAYPMQFSKDVNVLITFGAPKGKIAVAFTFTFGEGKVVYTSFHNHANTSKIEQALIAYLVATPINEAKQIQEQQPREIESNQDQQDKQRKQNPVKPKVESEPKPKEDKAPPWTRLPSPKK